VVTVEIGWLAALFGVGVVAGAINTLAGAGSLLVLPALIALGLPATEANATNRIGVLMQSIAGAARFRRDGALRFQGSLAIIVPIALGAALGAWLSVDIDEVVFRRIIGGVMIAMVGALFLRPERWLDGRKGEPARHLRWSGPIVFFVVGLYGGFLQAGVGVFLVASMVWVSGLDLVRATALKTVVVGLYTIPPIVIFIAYDLVAWGPALALAAGGMVGAWIGAKAGVRYGAGFLRWVLIVVVLLSALALIVT